MENSTLMVTVPEYDYLENFNHHDFEVDYEGSRSEDRYIEFPIIVSIVIALSLIGNILVVVRLRSLTSIFILNLALSDLLFTVQLPFWLYFYFRRFPLGDAACRVFSYIFSAGYYSSIVFLVLISLQHYMAIVHPLPGWKKGLWVTHVPICAWMLSILASLLVLGFPSLVICSHGRETAFLVITYKENIVFLCAFLFMGFCYIRILQTIFKSPTNQRHRTTGLAFLLVATFFICWSPFNIVKFLLNLAFYSIRFSRPHLLDYACYICHLLAFTLCCLNPVIYGVFGLIFRKTERMIFQRRATLDATQTEIEESQ